MYRLVKITLTFSLLTACSPDADQKSFQTNTANVYISEFRKTEILANKGDTTAQYETGRAYAKGDGVPKNDEKAVDWFLKAAAQGDQASQYNLGILYSNGRGVPKDYDQAFYWYEKAAAQGNKLAQYNLGHHYFSGTYIEKDLSKAMEMFRKSANQGYAKSQYLSLIHI